MDPIVSFLLGAVTAWLIWPGGLAARRLLDYCEDGDELDPDADVIVITRGGVVGQVYGPQGVTYAILDYDEPVGVLSVRATADIRHPQARDDADAVSARGLLI